MEGRQAIKYIKMDDPWPNDKHGLVGGGSVGGEHSPINDKAHRTEITSTATSTEPQLESDKPSSKKKAKRGRAGVTTSLKKKKKEDRTLRMANLLKVKGKE